MGPELIHSIVFPIPHLLPRLYTLSTVATLSEVLGLALPLVYYSPVIANVLGTPELDKALKWALAQASQNPETRPCPVRNSPLVRAVRLWEAQTQLRPLGE